MIFEKAIDVAKMSGKNVSCEALNYKRTSVSLASKQLGAIQNISSEINELKKYSCQGKEEFISISRETINTI
jgi:hypothetical protein